MKKYANTLASRIARTPSRPAGWLLFLCVVVSPAFGEQAQQQPTRPGFSEVIQAPVMVISATRTEKPLEEAPLPVEVISKQQIEQQNAKDLSEALEYARGVLVQPIHGKTGDGIKIQGINSDRILVLIDGERVTASTGSTVDLSQIGVSDIAQIEIVKGASSALYGSNAMGGVVNVITKTPQQGWHGTLKTSLTDYGDKAYEGVIVDQYDVAGELSYQGENYWSFASLSSRNSEGYEIINKGIRLVGPDGYKNNFSFGVGGKPSANTSIEISQRAYREDFVLWDFVRVPGQPALDRVETVNTDRTRLKTGWNVNEQFSLSLQGFVEEFENTRGDTKQRNSNIDTYNFDLQNNWTLNQKNIVTTGLNVNGESLTQFAGGVSELDANECGMDYKCERKATEFYAQLDHFLTGNIEIVPGFRYQEDSDFGSHFAPKISAMYNTEIKGFNTSWRGSVGNGYRVPNLKERYYIFDHSHLGYKVVGNLDLQPEEIISYQLGVDVQEDMQWAFGINVFYNDMEKFIQEEYAYNETGSGFPVTVYEYQNIAESRTLGFELSGFYQLQSWRVRANYQRLKSEDKNTKLALVQNPENLFKLGLDKSLLNNRANLLLQTRYESEAFINAANTIETPAFQVWDIKFDYRWRDALRYFAGIDNISDEHRDPLKVAAGGDLRPVPGREIYLGAQYTF